MYYNKPGRRGIETDDIIFKVLVCLETNSELNKAVGVVKDVYQNEMLKLDCVPYRREAATKCRREYYDVVILSDNDTDGYELNTAVYNIKVAHPTTKIVLLCRVLSDEIKDLEYRNFVEDIVLVPYQTQRLHDVLSRYSNSNFWS